MTLDDNSKGPGRREREITLSGLRTFVAVAEARSFAGAAQALGVSQPTVSVQLAALEDACGVLLLNRRPTLELTEAGAELFVRARLAVGRVEEFATSAKDLRLMQRGSLRIGMSTPHSVLPIVAAFMKSYPAVTLTTTIGNTAELLDQIARCRIDIGVMTLMEPPASFACALVSSPRLLVCMRADDPLARRAALRPAEVVDRPFVMREPGSMTRAVVEACFKADRVPLDVRLVLGSREAIKEAIAAGMGLGAVFENELGEDRRLTGVPLATQAKPHGVYAVALKESLDIPTVRGFIDHVPARARKSAEAKPKGR
ncbi:MAG: LysR family transcriptional regulator [Azospirillum sp.]|nr:LysR family transcriptional regulator [Azospirillum sp.]